MFITYHAAIYMLKFNRFTLMCAGELVFILPFLHRDIHPDGLPPGYTIILMFRLLPDSPNQAFDIWQVSDKNGKPETGVTIDRKSAVTYSLFSGNGKTVEETKKSQQLELYEVSLFLVWEQSSERTLEWVQYHRAFSGVLW